MNNIMNKAFNVLFVFFLMCGCTKYDRTNPFDPKNSSSRRDLKPIVLAFVYDDGTSNPDAYHIKAYAAYEQIQEPAHVLSFHIPISPDSITSLKSFLKNEWEPLSVGVSRILPRVFVGKSQDPIEGISYTHLHLESIESRISLLRNKSSYWTLEGEARISGNLVTLEIRIARLGSTRSGYTTRVMAFVAEPQTSFWSKVTYAYEEQSLGPIDGSDIKTITFSKALSLQEIPDNKIYFVIIVNDNGDIEQGAGFE